MSPEQIKGEAMDGRSDIYTLGAIAFQLLAGQLPYAGQSQHSFLFKHVYEPIPHIRSVNPALPPTCQAVLEQAMAKDPNDRYPTATAFVGALAGLAGDNIPTLPEQAVASPPVAPDLPTQMDTPSGVVPSPKPSRSQRPGRFAAIGGTSILLSIGFIAFVAFLAVLMGRDDNGETSQTQSTAPNASLGDRWTRPADGMVMVYVPEGSFLMGSDPDKDPSAREEEFLQHDVTLDGFWLDQTEVTNAQFATFVDETGYVTTAEEDGDSRVCDETGSCSTISGAYWDNPQGDGDSALRQHPVVHVSWFDAEAYCGWAEGALPTEAQWEYSARGSTNPIYPWGDTFDGTRLNFCDRNCPFSNGDNSVDDGYALTAPVGIYPSGASWVGAWDMAGNVWEWVDDWYDGDYYNESPVENPAGPTDGTEKVLRGGGWDNIASNVRSANRNVVPPTLSFDFFGFRCVVPA